MSDGQEPTAPPTGQEPTGEPATLPNGQEPGSEPESFSREYVEKLRREAAGYRTRLQDFEDSQKTEQQKLAEERDALRGEATTWQGKALRYEAAAQAGLDLKLAPRLQGSSLEELVEDAKQLAETFGGPRQGPDNGPVGGGGARGGAPAQDMNSFIRRGAGVKVN